ncbi:hypothetical protein A1A1_05502 [Planococcus antarcticus DSM 14505]|uniref:Uncharacterized protein n=1 Tax=Planococcus antarcticus DSM 14505 TaxID=1185653 RepID=A0A1C7DEW1_9BACL|nr:hypothetical protein [Planococcus antarcticus]ANU09763.1 hypothetical protein BBH88_05350 [Planococcus antarcticus DSM 14505]EIM07640.1 hypothetical protein A1A1_05502 [Planococcus antarcticus DSM 14505]
MLKKSVIAVLFSVVMALGLGTSVFAESNNEAVKYDVTNEMTPEVAKAIAEVNKTNEKIYEEINKAVDKSEKMYAKYQDEKSKHQDVAKQALLTKEYEEKSAKLISELKVKTESMTLKGIEKAEKAGLIMEIEWVLIEFADREELIDPMVVVGW